MTPAAARRDYVQGMVRLGVFHVRTLLVSGRLPARALVDALSRRVNLYRLTTLWDGEHDVASGHFDARWHDLATGLASLFASTADPESLERRVLDQLEPWLDMRVPGPPRAPFGCWSYQVVGPGIADAPGIAGRTHAAWRRVCRWLGCQGSRRDAELHFVNALAPESPFSHPHQLRVDLLALLHDCRVRAPTVTRVWCNSWLNNRTVFTALFPRAWRDSAVARPPDLVDAMSGGRARLNTENWWGQFQRRDGSFHAENAQRFRRAGGEFPIPNLLCHASLGEIEAHLGRELAAGASTC
jgi:hypothetical protein